MSHTTTPASWQNAIALFNRQAYFDCHEVLEILWQAAPMGPEKLLLQGVLQVAVGLHHAQQHNFVGARNKLQEGLEKLHQVAGSLSYPSPIPLRPLIQQTEAFLQALLRLGPEGIATLLSADGPPPPHIQTYAADGDSPAPFAS